MTAHDDLRRDVVALQKFLDRYVTEVPALISRAQIPTGRDGFPRTASGADRSSPGNAPEMPSAECKEVSPGNWAWRCSCGLWADHYTSEGHANLGADRHLDHHHATSTLDYSDPTGDAAVARPEPDPAKARLKRVRHLVDRMLRDGADICGILDAEKVDRDKATVSGDEDQWCKSCARDGGYCEPVDRKRSSRHCSWCQRFIAEHHFDPPLWLIQKRRLTGRVYDADITRAVAESKRRKSA